MNKVERHIVYLLNEKGFVEIPGFGVLSLTHIPAAFDGKTIAAPKTIVNFDDAILTNTDTALASSIAKKDSVDIDTASDILSSGLSDIKCRINKVGQYTIENLGNLSYEDGDVKFEMSQDARFTARHYPELILTPLSKRETNDKKLPAYADTEEKREEFLRSLRRTASSAAAIAIVAVFAFLFTQLPKFNSTAQQASLVDTQVEQNEVKSFQNPTNSKTDPALVLIFNTPDDASCEVEVTEPVENISAEEAVIPAEVRIDDAKYCLVVASLASEAEARKFIEYTDCSLSLLIKDGHFRVYAMQGKSYEGLMKDAKNAGLYDKYPSAWICRK